MYGDLSDGSTRRTAPENTGRSEYVTIGSNYPFTVLIDTE